MDLYLLIGTNLGNRSANIRQALELLECRFGPITARSRSLATKACGFDGPEFQNMVAVFDSSEDPLSILAACKDIERQMGRSDMPEYDECGNRVYHDRIIDIDILEYGQLSISTSELTIPHPQIISRPFVAPLLEEAKNQI